MTLSDLERRLESAKEGSRELDEAILHALNVEHHCEYHSLNLTTSLDKSVALAEAVLPGCHWTASNYCGAFVHSDDKTFWSDHGKDKAPALALCLAIIRALKEKA